MKIAIVGAGEAGHDLLTLLHDNKEVTIDAICDNNTDAKGLKLASELGIPIEKDFENFTRKNLDVIVEVTGSNYVRNRLEELFEDTKTSVLGAQSAKLLSVVISDAIKNAKKLDDQLIQINHSTNELQNEFHTIMNSVKTLDSIKKELHDSVKTSMRFVLDSSELTQSINKIAQKNKILGLNANIEAARAGEAGKGFSIVANEIQKLSTTTNTFADEIAESLESISNEVTGIYEKTESLTDLANKQSESTDQLENILEELLNKIEK
jgi:methyl-accepting chemotaxis protein